jgi:hypothetical protein
LERAQQTVVVAKDAIGQLAPPQPRAQQHGACRAKDVWPDAPLRPHLMVGMPEGLSRRPAQRQMLRSQLTGAH